MGNSQHKPGIALQITEKQVVLHYAFKIKLKIGYLTKFPHKYEGLKLWDCNIILARFIILNSDQFKDKQILELASGTGLAGITLKKWTTAKHIAITDLSDEVIENIKNNFKRNDIEKTIVFKMLWRQYESFKKKYDIIMVSDPFFHHCTPENLYNIMLSYLQVGGHLIMASPKSQQLQLFLNMIQPHKFEKKMPKMDNTQYLNSPLLNLVQGQEQFPSLSRGQISIYKFTKIYSADESSPTVIKSKKVSQLINKIKQHGANDNDDNEIKFLRPAVEDQQNIEKDKVEEDMQKKEEEMDKNEIINEEIVLKEVQKQQNNNEREITVDKTQQKQQVKSSDNKPNELVNTLEDQKQRQQLPESDTKQQTSVGQAEAEIQKELHQQTGDKADHKEQHITGQQQQEIQNIQPIQHNEDENIGKQDCIYNNHHQYPQQKQNEQSENNAHHQQMPSTPLKESQAKHIDHKNQQSPSAVEESLKVDGQIQTKNEQLQSPPNFQNQHTENAQQNVKNESVQPECGELPKKQEIQQIQEHQMIGAHSQINESNDKKEEEKDGQAQGQKVEEGKTDRQETIQEAFSQKLQPKQNNEDGGEMDKDEEKIEAKDVKKKKKKKNKKN